MKVCGFIVVLGLALLITPVPASAQPVPVPETGVEISCRAPGSRVTGADFGTSLARKASCSMPTCS